METYKIIIIAIIIVIMIIVEIYNRYKPNIEIIYEAGRYNVILWYYKHKDRETYRTYVKLFKI
jgi:membrane-bound lytic murein transglycosylase MltF